ncbi:RNA polymerase sigma-70 factor [Spirosoma endbachense]|uniref:RNA polymerase sigma-70 factor n=1 Tax=Spirosoma endbachense TaxID=2666025 RepID=A0A6P1VPK9_9BACT|nr:RNA polymerase sigma-70 factor [Spirosoma endbachense]QHV94554.1 RNA polymerase sigma-70 factor [Spirosoma endbachense]
MAPGLPFDLPGDNFSHHPDPVAGAVPPKPDDELLIRHAFQTDAYQGCDLLFRRYYHPLCSQAVRFVYDKALAEDIVAELFQTFWQKRIYERIDYSYRAYLYRAVRQNCLLFLQREAGQTISTDQLIPADLLIDPASPSDQIQFDELNERIEVTINALSSPVRRVFLLSRFEGRKNQEIADELHISLKTVEAHVTKALALFRKVLLP